MDKKIINLEIPIERLHIMNELMLIAPMYDPLKGWGYVMTPVPRELLDSECRPMLEMIDEAIVYYKERFKEGFTNES